MIDVVVVAVAVVAVAVVVVVVVVVVLLCDNSNVAMMFEDKTEQEANNMLENKWSNRCRLTDR